MKNLETKLVHAGEARVQGAVSMPIFQSVNYLSRPGEGYHDIEYIRLNNTPNHRALGEKLAAVEDAESALVLSSGMAAISSCLFSVLSAGDHVLFHKCLYGGTQTLAAQDLPQLGIQVGFIDANEPNTWKEQLRPNTKVIYVESITNPLLEVGDLEAVVSFAQEHGVVSMIDNTFASPVNFRPPEWGFDLSIHSCTKYLNGHSDIAAGAVIGKKDLVAGVTKRANHLGGALDPHACFLLQRGMKTLALRVRQQNQSALAIARFLHEHPAVSKVNYPGLPSHPEHERAKKLFDGFGGMLSFELDAGAAGAETLFSKLKVPLVAPSLGGVESLITMPVKTSHAGLSKEELTRAGITDKLIRLSVGVEGLDDLLEDFSRALAQS